MQLYTTAQWLAMSNDILKKSFAANLMRMEPNGSCPIFALTGLAKELQLKAHAHSYFSKRFTIPSVTLTAPVTAAGDTTFTVDNPSALRVGSVLMVYKHTNSTYNAPEFVRVTAVGASTIDVERGFAGTSAASAGIANGTVLLEIQSAFEEGSAKPTSRSIALQEHTNYMQIFRDSWDLTGTMEAVELTPNVNPTANNKEDAMFFHGANIEQGIIFGRKSASTINGRPVRTMDGIEAMVQAMAPDNISVAGATTTFKQLEAMLHPVFDVSTNGRKSNSRIIWAGTQAMETIAEIGRASGYYELQPDSNSFGMEFRRFRTTRGMFEVIEHPILSSTPATTKMAIIGDPRGLDLLYLRKTAHKDIAFDGTDAVSGVYTTECTLELNAPTEWGIIYNLTAGAAS